MLLSLGFRCSLCKGALTNFSIERMPTQVAPVCTCAKPFAAQAGLCADS